MSLLKVENISKRFGGLAAVDGVSFEIEAGSVSAIIGPNGAGKTTLFNLISGFLPPTAGRVLFKDQVVTGLPAHRVAAAGIVRTFQLVQLFPDLTALQNVQAGCHLQGNGGLWAALARTRGARAELERATAASRDLLAFVGLQGREHLIASALPYGQQRLLEVARAVAASPTLLLLDEPAAGLNAIETEHLAQVIGQIAARGITVLLIEHDMGLVMRVARHIVVLDFGKKIAEGSPEEVQRHPAVLEAYLGSAEAAREAQHA